MAPRGPSGPSWRPTASPGKTSPVPGFYSKPRHPTGPHRSPFPCCFPPLAGEEMNLEARGVDAGFLQRPGRVPLPLGLRTGRARHTEMARPRQLGLGGSSGLGGRSHPCRGPSPRPPGRAGRGPLWRVALPGLGPDPATHEDPAARARVALALRPVACFASVLLRTGELRPLCEPNARRTPKPSWRPRPPWPPAAPSDRGH